MRTVVFVLFASFIAAASASGCPSVLWPGQKCDRCSPHLVECQTYCVWPGQPCPKTSTGELEAVVSCPRFMWTCPDGTCAPPWSGCPTTKKDQPAVLPRPQCPHLQAPCDGGCIPPWACCNCDGAKAANCEAGSFHCPAAKKCIKATEECRAESNLPAISEQSPEEPHKCPSNRYWCGNGCYSVWAGCCACDPVKGCVYNCPGGSKAAKAAESNLPAISQPLVCPHLRFPCNGGCIPPWACCNCDESKAANCEAGSFHCPAAKKCIKATDECRA